MSRTSEYRAFTAAVIAERGSRCESCSRTAAEARQDYLHVHHIWAVSKSGIDSPLVMSRRNVQVLCNYCHRLAHPGFRSWDFHAIGQLRGAALVA
jgi:predicted HNH restriction endonuclease